MYFIITINTYVFTTHIIQPFTFLFVYFSPVSTESCFLQYRQWCLKLGHKMELFECEVVKQDYVETCAPFIVDSNLYWDLVYVFNKSMVTWMLILYELDWLYWNMWIVPCVYEEIISTLYGIFCFCCCLNKCNMHLPSEHFHTHLSVFVPLCTCGKDMCRYVSTMDINYMTHCLIYCQHISTLSGQWQMYLLYVDRPIQYNIFTIT